MKVSIITPVFNGASTIERTIRSVISQKDVLIEYIIVDGLSTDGTDDIIRKYRKYVTKYIREKDTGLYDAMNKGISMASGDLVGIINSDDWYEPGCIKKVVEFYSVNNCDIIYGDFNVIDGEKVRIQKAHELKKMCTEMVTPHPTMFVKRSVYNKMGGYNLRYKMAADYDFALNCYMSNESFGYINDVLSNFSLGGLSTLNVDLSEKETHEIMKKRIDDKILRECFEKLLDLRIVVHGAGFWGTWLVEKLTELYTNNIIWVDQNYDKKKETVINGIGVMPVNECEFDRQVIVAVYEGETIENQYRNNGKRTITISALLNEYMNCIFDAKRFFRSD
ncbi:Glycosyl transferase family 2 [Lachnospiraceae bacterium]|nr:Glycosyl transferase family 2 [Lachnospiraceae bacterium]